jgi:hypothetical protein
MPVVQFNFWNNFFLSHFSLGDHTIRVNCSIHWSRRDETSDLREGQLGWCLLLGVSSSFYNFFSTVYCYGGLFIPKRPSAHFSFSPLFFLITEYIQGRDTSGRKSIQPCFSLFRVCLHASRRGMSLREYHDVRFSYILFGKGGKFFEK